VDPSYKETAAGMLAENFRNDNFSLKKHREEEFQLMRGIENIWDRREG
jgi:hypothetical protein